MKFITWTMLSLFALGIMFTACSDDIGTEKQLTAETELNAEEGYMLLPSDIMQKDESAIDNYVANLSNEDFIAHQNAYLIMKYLEELELENYYADYIIAANFTDANLLEHLDQAQIDELKTTLISANQNTAVAESRGTCCYTYYMEYCAWQSHNVLFCCCGDLVTRCNYCTTPGGPQ